MSKQQTGLQLTKTRLLEGTWEGVLTNFDGDAPPSMKLRHQDQSIEGLTVERVDGTWYVRAPIPLELISDGVHVFLITDENGQTLADFSIVAGEALAHDIRAEMELLREELDMLKSAFRRHCLEMAQLE